MSRFIKYSYWSQPPTTTMLKYIGEAMALETVKRRSIGLLKKRPEAQQLTRKGTRASVMLVERRNEGQNPTSSHVSNADNNTATAAHVHIHGCGSVRVVLHCDT